MRAALVICAKDLRQRMRDRSALVLAFVVPFALAAVLGLTLGEVASGDVTFDYALVDEDGGRLATSFRADVLGGLEREGLVRLRAAESAEAARRLAAAGSVDAAFVVPAGFTAAVEGGSPARLDVIGDANALLGTEVARSIAGSFVAEVNAVRVSVATVATLRGGLDAASLAELGERAAATESPVRVADTTAESRALDYRTYYAAGMAVFFLFFTVQFGVSSLLGERKDGTLWRLVAAPIPRWTVLAGKLLVSFVLGLASMAVLVAGTSLLLGAHWGNPVGVGILVVCGVLAATGLMALIATVAKTTEQAGYFQAMAALVLGMLGGAFFPVAQAGGAIATISLATPQAWFLRGLGELAGGAGPSAALVPAGVILAFALVTGAIAVARLDRIVQP
jgi:ABC-2 type transport system permease protein